MKRKFLLSALVLVLTECAAFHVMWASGAPRGEGLAMGYLFFHVFAGFFASMTWFWTSTPTAP